MWHWHCPVVLVLLLVSVVALYDAADCHALCQNNTAPRWQLICMLRCSKDSGTRLQCLWGCMSDRNTGLCYSAADSTLTTLIPPLTTSAVLEIMRPKDSLFTVTAWKLQRFLLYHVVVCKICTLHFHCNVHFTNRRSTWRWTHELTDSVNNRKLSRLIVKYFSKIKYTPASPMWISGYII